MHKHANVLLNLCLSSLVFTIAMVATATPRISATETQSSTSSLTKVAQANPCSSKNPGTGKGNVGRALAQQLQGKPVVVDIYASWCPKCQTIAPTLSQLKKEYSGKAHFVVLDVSDKAKASQAEAQARQLGLGQFFSANKAQTAMVAIIDPATGNILAQYRGNPNKTDYTSVLNAAISRN